MTHPQRRRVTLQDIDWTVVIAISLMHLVGLMGFFYFTWSALAIFVLLCWVTGGLGITLGFHRLLTHRSFKTPKIVEYALTLMGCLTLQGRPTQWVGTHRIHHAESDTDADPHTPKHGFTWAHMFWCMVYESPRGMAKNAAKDLLRDPVMRQIDRFYWMPNLLLAVLFYFLGGWPWVIWGVCLRTAVVYHVTWFVNSAAHTWGYRNFQTTDDSRNTWWVALLSFGEGWHNNHHAFQRSAAHGMKWWELDMTYWTILLMNRVGLAWDVVKPDIAVQQEKAEKLAANLPVETAR